MSYIFTKKNCNLKIYFILERSFFRPTTKTCELPGALSNTKPKKEKNTYSKKIS